MTSHDWQVIQKDYDENLLTTRQLKDKYHLYWWQFTQAKKNNWFKGRSHSESNRVSKSPPRKHSEETKNKLSEIRKKHLQEHPDQVPYLLNHYSKGDSYPETYFKDVFEKENIQLLHHKQVGLYQLDFYNDALKIYIEIDGEQHYVDKRIVESDIRRTEYLKNLGWSGKRIRWAEYQKLQIKERKSLINEIKSLLTTT
jgi:very-short-patch-repair endonuclease